VTNRRFYADKLEGPGTRDSFEPVRGRQMVDIACAVHGCRSLLAFVVDLDGDVRVVWWKPAQPSDLPDGTALRDAQGRRREFWHRLSLRLGPYSLPQSELGGWCPKNHPPQVFGLAAIAIAVDRYWQEEKRQRIVGSVIHPRAQRSGVHFR
jgi:hypothetical protein